MDRFVPFQGNLKFLAKRKDGYAKWAADSQKYGRPRDLTERRTKFKHDEDEIIYSKAYRRLSHKSQIIVRPDSDHFRTRLTHTQEVNQIAESIAYRLGLNLNLVNAIALGHDIGHCPFGHAGEREIQYIVKRDILNDRSPLCNAEKLAKELGKRYGFSVATPIQDHWLFHHAINSVRLIERKMKNIQEATREGIIRHSWSPWRSSPKFGIPLTYEAQAVAIADQVASINHDTEDILSRPDYSQYALNRVCDELPKFFEDSGFRPGAGLGFCNWFLAGEASEENGFSRKIRLQRIINSVVKSSLSVLEQGAGATPDEAITKPLSIDPRVGRQLEAYENFIRDHVIKGVSWFRHRDAVSESVIRTSYDFFRHYGRTDKPVVTGPPELAEEVHHWVEEFRKSTGEKTYTQDRYWRALEASHEPDKLDELTYTVKAIDYVVGMTDKRIMEVHTLALTLFQ